MNINETYGEILSESVTKLLRLIPMTENDVFLDLGSGKGKVVSQVFAETNVKEARGIELLPALHAEAERNKSARIPVNRSLTFIQGDFLQVPFTAATIVFIASPCFGASLLHQLGDKLNHTPTIHTVLSLRPIATLSRLTFKKIVRIECSWDSALCYIYR